jgi:exopolysaccharide biosynthesis polyprenyl glycosylphosphotransferase
MGTKTGNRRGAVWTTIVLAGAVGTAALLAAGVLWASTLPGMLLTAGAFWTGLLLVSPAARPARRGREAGLRATTAPVRRRRRVIIVGAGDMAQALARELAASGQREVIGFVEDSVSGDARVLGPRDQLLALAREHAADEVIIAEAPSWQEQLLQQALGGTGAPLQVAVVPSLYETAIGRLPRQRVRDIPLLPVSPWQRSAGYEIARRAWDVMFSLAALGVTAPFCLLAALAIKLTSPGPVLFRQERVGRGGARFWMLKFRTMVLDAERDGPALCTGYDDTRLTPVGRLLRKTRLDEIPQFVNVIRGEMSVIGPRPERPVYVTQFENQVPGYQERHRIRPGITGLAQVNGSYHSNAREKLRYDLFYLYHRSPWLDSRILLRTITAMIH